MAITRTDRNQTFGPDGRLLAENVVEVDITEEVNQATLHRQVRDHLADLRTITGSSGTLTAAQLSNAVRALARGQIGLIRLAVDLLDATD